MATLSYDIRQYFPGITDGATSNQWILTNNHVHELTNLRTDRGVNESD
jgi:hypothetical protein